MRATLCVLLLLGLVPLAQSDEPYRVGITAQKKRLEVQRTQTDSKEKVAEKWGYAITIANQAFKDIPDVQVDYMIFYRTEAAGRAENATRDKRSSGSKNAGLLKNNTRFTCETDPIALQKTELNADWSYGNGAKRESRDVITGIKVRVKSGANVISEFADPASLKSSEAWE
ncbi:MAG: hypothetical protein M3Y80_10235 [Verrucomicrobiota bacterium]|nr:hypothetical protein [Verrucomicrobiota bacterium]